MKIEKKMISDNPDIAKAQEQRMKDALRLAQTKLNNIEESLAKLRAQQESLRRFHKLNSDLKEHSHRLFLLNKEQACLATEATELERFETFESIMAPFIRMNIMETEAQEIHSRSNALEQESASLAKNIEEKKKQLGQCKDAVREARIQIPELFSTLQQCHFHQGASEALKMTVDKLTSIIEDINETLISLEKEKEELERDVLEDSKSLEKLNEKHQILVAHEAMIQKGDLILSQLERLGELEDIASERKKLRDESLSEQTRQNELLGNLYKQYQSTEQEILSTQDELNVHRYHTHGQTSYRLQENAMNLKSRHQMLLSAQSLWRRISTGYTAIEDKNVVLNSLSLEIEQLTKNTEKMQHEVDVLTQLAREKEYAFNISKSQNVIQLRGDLNEGRPCSVCGATHHPYHSDTMLEQSKLISDFKSDYEQYNGELRGKKIQLEELKESLSKALGQQVAEKKNLETVRQRQSEDVNEWRVFAHLDISFAECSSSTNRDARMAMLRQLIDNTQKDATRAQAELDEYNYHTQQIEQLSLKIASLKEKNDELSIRMNEVNTACQVMVRQVEDIDSRWQTTHEKFHTLYKLLATKITLPEWHSLWEKNHDTVNQRIQEMMSQWNREVDDLSKLEQKKAIMEARLDVLVGEIQNQVHNKDSIATLMELLVGRREELENNITSLLPDRSVSGIFEDSFNHHLDIEDKEKRITNELNEISSRQTELSGALATVSTIGNDLDEKVSAQRGAVDIWMHGYNTSHPPVQYSELSVVLTQDRDWNEQRQKVRDNQMQLALEQRRVDDLSAELIAMGAEVGNITAEQASEMQFTGITQIEDLESKRRETVMQIANLQLQLTHNNI